MRYRFGAGGELAEALRGRFGPPRAVRVEVAGRGARVAGEALVGDVSVDFHLCPSYDPGMPDVLPRLELSGDAIRAARERAGLRRERLAADVGVSISTIERAETGRNVPAADVVAAIARRLDVPMETLFAESSAPASSLASNEAA